MLTSFFFPIPQTATCVMGPLLIGALHLACPLETQSDSNAAAMM